MHRSRSCADRMDADELYKLRISQTAIKTPARSWWPSPRSRWVLACILSILIMKFLLSSSLSVFALLNLCNARSIVRRAENTDITQWLNKQIPFAKDRILAHINADGAIVAGSAPPVQEEGDPYQYFWVRDGGLTMMALADLWHQTGSSDIPPKFDAFHSWTLKTQDAARKSSPGWFTDKQAWTKYTLDGQPFKQWMSPQVCVIEVVFDA